MVRQVDMQSNHTNNVEASQKAEAPTSLNAIPEADLTDHVRSKRKHMSSTQSFDADIDYEKYFEEDIIDVKSPITLKPLNSHDEYQADDEDEKDNWEEESVDEAEPEEDSDDEEAFNKFYERYLEVEKLKLKKY